MNLHCLAPYVTDDKYSFFKGHFVVIARPLAPHLAPVKLQIYFLRIVPVLNPRNLCDFYRTKVCLLRLSSQIF